MTLRTLFDPGSIAVGDLVERHEEIDVNPVLASAEEAVALDALVVLEE